MKKTTVSKSRAVAVRAKRLPIRTEEASQFSPDVVPVAFHEGMQLLPVQQQNLALAEYDARRKNFLQWLFSHIVEGIHYGFPPGCEARYDDNGNLVGRDGSPVRPTQWLPKPSLYKSGAQLIVDLLHLQPMYENDLDAWKMMGEPKGVVVRRCTISAMGKRLGEGTGAFSVGKKGMDENSAVKMADKRALVAAVFNAVAVIGELFTQDIEEKLAERKAGDVKTMRKELYYRVENLLVGKSKWTGEIQDFIQVATANMFGPGQTLSSPSKIQKFNDALSKNLIDLDTAAVKN